MANLDLLQRLEEAKVRVVEIVDRYSLGSPANVKPFTSRKELETTLRPDLLWLVQEVQLVYEVAFKLFKQLEHDQNELRELKAPKVVVATEAQLKQIEKQAVLREGKR